MENISRGKLYFFYGCMNSGKSLQLLATAYNFQERKIPFIVLKSDIDTRDGEGVIHSRALGDRQCICISSSTDIYTSIVTLCNINRVRGEEKIKWVLVDEAQFLTKEQVNQLGAVADRLGINVICYGLRTDFQTKLFPGSKRLFEIADNLEEIKSSCDCNNKNIFNARIDRNGNVITDGEQIEVGGDDRYVAMCRNCYYEHTGNKLYKKKEDNDEI